MTSKPSPNSDSRSYSQLQDELDAVLAQLQSDGVDVDKALVLYQQACQLIGLLELRLAAAQNRVKELRSE